MQTASPSQSSPWTLELSPSSQASKNPPSIPDHRSPPRAPILRKRLFLAARRSHPMSFSTAPVRRRPPRGTPRPSSRSGVSSLEPPRVDILLEDVISEHSPFIRATLTRLGVPARARLRQAAVRVAGWLHAARRDAGRRARPRRARGPFALRAPAAARAGEAGAASRWARAHRAQAGFWRRHLRRRHGSALALVQARDEPPRSLPRRARVSCRRPGPVLCGPLNCRLAACRSTPSARRSRRTGCSSRSPTGTYSRHRTRA